MFRKSLLAAALLAGTSLGAMAGTVTPVNNAPLDGVIYGFLLTDGSLLFQGGLLQDFYRFKPDKKGSYVNGTLFPAAALPPNYVPYATSGGVLPDGRVLLIGGEYTLRSNNTLTFDLHKQDGDLRSEGGYVDDGRAAFRSRLGFHRRFAVDDARQRASVARE